MLGFAMLISGKGCPKESDFAYNRKSPWFFALNPTYGHIHYGHSTHRWRGFKPRQRRGRVSPNVISFGLILLVHRRGRNSALMDPILHVGIPFRVLLL